MPQYAAIIHCPLSLESASNGPMRSTILALTSLLVILAGSVDSAGTAVGDIPGVCDTAARNAASKHSVPLAVLKGVSRAETGRRVSGRLEPWPWTVNMEGTGHWFQSRDEAMAFVFRHFKAGARSFDVGCFQINYKWHHKGFGSLEEMFDPTKNAVYAAQFLQDLHVELGSWDAAVGAYHSRTEKYAKRYLERYTRIAAQLPKEASLKPLMSRRQPMFAVSASTDLQMSNPDGTPRVSLLRPRANNSTPLIDLN